MSEPRLHHYVPQFYLKRFADPAGRLWAWNKETGSSFAIGTGRLAAERDFYRQQWLAVHGHDPMTMEKQLADLEGEVAAITGQWLFWLRDAEVGDVIPVSQENREIIALHLALQHMRTADYRDTFGAYVAETGNSETINAVELAALHTKLLWTDEVFRPLQMRLQSCTWIFARNRTERSFVTSDNPLAFKTGDNRQWVKAGVMAKGVYAVYPLAPDLILYCHPLEGRFTALKGFDCKVSPVALTTDMVEHENCGQVFGASRFVVANENDFDFARAFTPTIGTDINAPRAQKTHLGREG